MGLVASAPDSIGTIAIGSMKTGVSVNGNTGSNPQTASVLASKVPQVTLAFWVIKILATTVGETGGDAVSMTLNLGYAVASVCFIAFFAVVLAIQLTAKRYHPATYWAVVVGTTTVGTTVSDFFDRTAGMGYVLSSLLLFCGVLALLYAWYKSVGRISFENIATRREELFYWFTILVSNTLGTALGDCVASSVGMGFERGAMLFGGLIVLLAAAHFWLRRVPASVLFWSAYVLTRPLGATLGDMLTKPVADGGFDLGRVTTTMTIGAVMVVLILLVARFAPKQPATPVLP
jgi:uncharacterized membrane-anchored protein